MPGNESAENYLETILVLRREKGAVRSIDVVQRMNFSKPSVSRAVGLLKENGYITVDDGGHLRLTASGHEIAEKIYERHTVLTAVLTYIGVDSKTAAEDACKIEHDISDETFAAIKRHVKSKQEEREADKSEA